MKRVLLIAAIALPVTMWAQESGDHNKKEAERIIITKKGDDSKNLVIEVKGDQVIVNGKPVGKDEEGDITVKRIKIKDFDNWAGNLESADGAYNLLLGHEPEMGRARVIATPNKAMLGVVTEKADEGAKVMSVNEETAAKKAGIQVGDIITGVDGKKITTPSELSEALKNKKPGDQVTIAYLRDGKSATAVAALTKWTAPRVMTYQGNFPMEFSSPNIDIEELMSRVPKNQGNADSFGRQYFSYSTAAARPKLGIKIQELETGTGVKIIELEKDSDADKAGLKEGDIIKEANGLPIKGTEGLLAQTRKSTAGSTLKLKVDRNGKPQNIDVIFRKKVKTANL